MLADRVPRLGVGQVGHHRLELGVAAPRDVDDPGVGVGDGPGQGGPDALRGPGDPDDGAGGGHGGHSPVGSRAVPPPVSTSPADRRPPGANGRGRAGNQPSTASSVAPRAAMVSWSKLPITTTPSTPTATIDSRSAGGGADP